MLRVKSSDSYTPDHYVDTETETGSTIQGMRRNEVNTIFLRQLNVGRTKNHAKQNAENIRVKFSDYFYGPGQVE